jgi:tetratricopeptide (TPR) repeat protein
LLQLDGLPLALAQAAAYMTKTSISFDTYTRLYNENWKDLMELNNTKHIPLRNYANGSVATTWTISFNSLRRSNEAAANLLLLWAHLDNKSMWYGLLSAATKISETTTKRISEWLGDIACSETEFIKAIGLLRSYSLVEKTEDRANCSTHAVVHQWALNIQNEEQLKELSWIAIVAVGKAVALRDKPTFWVPIEQLLTHANKCGNLIKEKSNAWCEQYELDAQACKNGNNDEDDWERKGGGTIPKALFCLSALYRSVGDLYKAEDICKQALSLWKRVAGEKHELTVITSNALGDIYLESGKLGEAEEAYSYALKFYEGAQREDSEFALRITYRLGRLHLAQGKPEEAARAYIRVLEGCNKMQEADGTLVLNAFRDLGAICPDPRKLTELGEMCSRVLERQTKALGTDHNSATEGMRLLAEFYMIQGRPEETETTYLQALKICEAQEIRPRVKLDLFKGFGEFYLHQSKLEDAKAIHIQAFEVCKETYGTMLEAAPTIGLVLCRICIQQGKLDEAVTWLSLMAPGYETLLAHDRAACQALQDFRVGLQKVIETRDQIKSGQETTPEATQGDIGQDTPPKETLPRRQGILQRLGWKRA